MKETKFLPEYKTRINGISVVFKDVPYTEKWGSKVFKINFHSKALENQICFNLLKDRPSMTGGVLKFVRHYLNWSLQDMASVLDITKTSIADWESSLDKVLKVKPDQYESIFLKLLSCYQSKMLEEILAKKDRSNNVYNDENPLDLRGEEESYYEVASN